MYPIFSIFSLGILMPMYRNLNEEPRFCTGKTVELFSNQSSPHPLVLHSYISHPWLELMQLV